MSTQQCPRPQVHTQKTPPLLGVHALAYHGRLGWLWDVGALLADVDPTIPCVHRFRHVREGHVGVVHGRVHHNVMLAGLRRGQ